MYACIHKATLHCTASRYTVLHHTTLYHTAPYYAILHRNTQHYTAPHYPMHHIVLHYTIQYCTTPHYTTLCCTYRKAIMSFIWSLDKGASSMRSISLAATPNSLSRCNGSPYVSQPFLLRIWTNIDRNILEWVDWSTCCGCTYFNDQKR